MTQVNGIAVWAEGIKAELAQRLPRQRKTQRDKLAVLVATMLHVRSANLVEVAAVIAPVKNRAPLSNRIVRISPNSPALCMRRRRLGFAGPVAPLGAGLRQARVPSRQSSPMAPSLARY